MNTIKFDFKALKKAKEKVDNLAKMVSEAESEIVLAENSLASAKQDDGIVAPEEIVKRTSDADRLVRIRQIEANRTAAKLSEAESEFHLLIDNAVQSVLTILMTKKEEEEERIRKLLVDILGKNIRPYELSVVIGMSDTMTRISSNVAEINRSRLALMEGFPNGRESLIENVLNAEALL